VVQSCDPLNCHLREVTNSGCPAHMPTSDQTLPPRVAILLRCAQVLSCRTLMWPWELDAMHDPPRRHQATLLRNWFASGFSLSR